MPLKAILFDLDGTLVDTDPIHLGVFAELLAPLGYNVDEEFFRTHISGNRNENIFKRYFPELSDQEIIQKGEEKEMLFRDRAKSIKPLTGLDKMISWARSQNIALALVTNAPKGNVDFILPILGLQDSFDIHVLADDLERGKPYPDPYLAALKRLDIAADDAVVFEDSGNGIRSSVAAGVFTYGLMTSHPAEELLAAGARMAILGYEDPALWHDLSRRINQ